MENETIDISILDKDELAKALRRIQETMKETELKREQEKQEMAKKVEELQNTIINQKDLLEMYRFPGIDKTKFPDLNQICQTFYLNPVEMKMNLEQNPSVWLSKGLYTYSLQISDMKQQLRESQVDINGKSIMDLVTKQEDNLWGKYTGPESVDENFAETLLTEKNNFFAMKKQLVIFLRYISDFGFKSEAMASLVIKYIDRTEPSNKVVAQVPEEDKSAKEVETLKKEMDSLKATLKDVTDKLAVKISKNEDTLVAEEQNKLINIAQDEIKAEDEEETETSEEENETPEEEKPKKGKRGR